MDNIKNNTYYIKKIVRDIEFVLEHTKNVNTYEELGKDEVLLDSVSYNTSVWKFCKINWKF